MSTKEVVCVKVLMSMINYATMLISEFDKDFQNKLRDHDERILWKIGEDIAFHTIIESGKITGSEGEINDPTIIFKINDVDVALDFLTRTKGIEDVMNYIQISGDAGKIIQLRFILETVSHYMEDLMD